MKSLSKKLRPPLITAAALFAALAVAGSAWATTNWDEELQAWTAEQFMWFKGKHIVIRIDSWGGYTAMDILYYDALVKNLDAFAASLKKKGKLNAERIQITSVMKSGRYDEEPEFTLERSGGSWYFDFKERKYITQNYMAKAIAYLATDIDTTVKWNSYSDTAALQKFNAVIDTIKVPYKFAPQKVKDVGNGFAVYFQGGRLACKDADNVYDGIDEVPFSVGSKTFIQAKKTVYIVENGKVTLKTAGEIKVPTNGKYSDFFIIAAPKTTYVVVNGEIKSRIEEKFSDISTLYPVCLNVYAIATAKALYIYEPGKAPYQFNEKFSKISYPHIVGSKIFIAGHIKGYAVFYAIEDGKVLDRAKIKEDCYFNDDRTYESCDYTNAFPEVFPKWVNYRKLGSSDYILSYSIEKNKFYKLIDDE